MFASLTRDILIPPRTSAEVVFGAPPSRTRVAVFCHYDPEGHATSNVVHYIRALSKAGLSVVVVSSSPTLTDDAVAAMRMNADLIIHRTNVGYDFGCYQEGIRRLGNLSRLDLLVLANDSVLGPFNSLEPLIERLDESADVWGLTDSREFAPHLQSYFMAFRPPALQSSAFCSFWRDYLALGSKEWAIRAGELGLSRTLRKDGLRLRALFPTDRLCAELHKQGDSDDDQLRALVSENVALNATHYFWRQLIRDHGFLFIKRELVERNPMKLHAVSSWREVVLARFGAASLSWLELPQSYSSAILSK